MVGVDLYITPRHHRKLEALLLCYTKYYKHEWTGKVQEIMTDIIDHTLGWLCLATKQSKKILDSPGCCRGMNTSNTQVTTLTLTHLLAIGLGVGVEYFMVCGE